MYLYKKFQKKYLILECSLEIELKTSFKISLVNGKVMVRMFTSKWFVRIITYIWKQLNRNVLNSFFERKH